jgi:hypothetical protein
MSNYDVNGPMFSHHESVPKRNREINEPEWLHDKIRLKTKVDVKFWSSVLKCNEKDLILAVSKIGNSLIILNQFLKLNKA